MSEVTTKISVGELLDKLSILEIKKNKITNEIKLSYIKNEFNILYNSGISFLNDTEIKELYNELVVINSKLWDVEDLIRLKENKKEFDSDFIGLARNVYITNDKRFEIKNKINKKTKSVIQEQKSYNYE